ncbi:hypothetical protein AVEN_157548-1 [Araneus ventricosus]|uniref:Uncharacterized protein n=1 Tax=Araneus ventricosus TaxID=182803 RepID=A0A4Y2KGH2_ARAVE|nr:hypothetical protein AVEN_157548-1 [Araneus ventricosus]
MQRFGRHFEKNTSTLTHRKTQVRISYSIEIEEMIKLIILIMILTSAANEKTCPERNIDCRVVRCANASSHGGWTKGIDSDSGLDSRDR